MAKGLIRFLLIIGGIVSTILGVIGIILPLLPTTPFLLLAAYCFARSSDTLYRRLLETKWLGTYIENFRSGKGIPLKTKWIAVIVLWTSSFYSIIYIVPLIIVQLMLFGVVIYITYYIFSLKTYR
ncbi:uncharacterized membrane protein YbaN (DUF454 family) [Salibacterium salarium]|uniref:YbaN family protein n=1 Tax=Salibacterium salarium TaxID=284579 RepID=UPI002786F7A4|nr:YbaN family protein [Salibacterium salarium]MDQ0300709.1 uncharacterized membrane protein YbaN (DUF454 family) [Salibacterium salarium]